MIKKIESKINVGRKTKSILARTYNEDQACIVDGISRYCFHKSDVRLPHYFSDQPLRKSFCIRIKLYFLIVQNNHDCHMFSGFIEGFFV